VAVPEEYVYVFFVQLKSPPGVLCKGFPVVNLLSTVLIWYWVGPVSPAFWWQFKQVELASVPFNKYDPPAFGACMLWQPSHSATPPEWKAYAIPLIPRAITVAVKTIKLNFNPFIFSS
jgi:hypothetical protein